MSRHSRAPMTQKRRRDLVAETGKHVAEALQAYERQNGPGWRRDLVAEDTAVLDRPADREATEAPMSTGSINDLPDSAFAYIEPGGKKDDDGKTVPRSLRHFPIHDAAHVRNALARASQSPFGDKALPKIRAAAKKLGVGAPAAGRGEAVDTAPSGQVTITETPTIVETPQTPGSKPGRLLVQLIKAGWSLNDRYYSEAVLKRDGPRAFPKGTRNYMDHDTDEQAADNPSGSVSRLASYQVGDAYWDAGRKALMAEVRATAPWGWVVLDWAESGAAKSGAVGMSIRAFAEGEPGEAEGKDGWIVNALTEGRSVDYVTRAAAGGEIVSVLEEIARRGIEEARNIGTWLESRLHLALTQLGDDMYGNGRLSREERIALSSAIGDALQAWTQRVEKDAPELFKRDIYGEPGQPATEAEEPAVDAEPTDTPAEPPSPVGDTPGPAAEPAEPEASTSDDTPPAAEPEPAAEEPATPDAPAAEPATPDQPTGAESAGPTSSEEKEVTNPTGAETPASPGSARQVIEAEVAQMRRQMALMEARETARRVLAQALSDGWIPPATVARITESLMERLPLSGDQLDEAELTKIAGRELARAEAEIAEAMQAAGVGRPRDLGQGGGSYTSGGVPGLGAADLDKQLEESFKRLGLTDKQAAIAARGRV